MKKLIFLASAIAAMFSFSGCSNGASDNNKKLTAEEARVTEWKSVSTDEIPYNPIAGLRDQWMLLAAGNDTAHNAMTIGWGSWGMLWGRPVVNVYVRTSRHTNEFMKSSPYFTVTAFPGDARPALQYMGSHSGRDENDKAASAGLTVEFTQLGNPVFKEATLAVECKTVYSTLLDHSKLPDHMRAMYTNGDTAAHVMYVGEIVNVMVKE